MDYLADLTCLQWKITRWQGNFTRRTTIHPWFNRKLTQCIFIEWINWNNYFFFSALTCEAFPLDCYLFQPTVDYNNFFFILFYYLHHVSCGNVFFDRRLFWECLRMSVLTRVNCLCFVCFDTVLQLRDSDTWFLILFCKKNRRK